MLLLYWLLDVGYILFGRFSFVERSLSSRACCLLWPITRKFMKREKDSIKIHPCAGIIFVADESLFLRRKRNPKRRSLFSGMHLLMDEQLLLHSSSNDTIERKTTLPSIFWVHVLGSSSNSLLVSLPLVFTTHRSQSGIAKNHLPNHQPWPHQNHLHQILCLRLMRDGQPKRHWSHATFFRFRLFPIWRK